MSDFDTKRVHAGYDIKEHHNSTNLPIYATASFQIESPEVAEKVMYSEQPGLSYSRVANPTVFALEKRIAALDGAESALAFSSGMAAVTATALALAGGNGNIVMGSALYGGTIEVFTEFYPQFGTGAKFVEDRFSPASYDDAVDENTKAIWVESISNPNAELYDIDAIAEVAHKHNIPLVVDNTIATPYLYNPFEHGADIIVYSATKGIAGHGSVLGGFVLEKGGFAFSEEKYPELFKKRTKLRRRDKKPRSIIDIGGSSPFITYLRAYFLEYFGAGIAPFEAFLVYQGLSTISERLDKQTKNAKAIAEYLQTKNEVEWVSYPELDGSRFRELAKRDFARGTGGILSFGFRGEKKDLSCFISKLKLFSYQVNIGDVHSLIVNPTDTTHSELDDEKLKAADITTNTIRLSLGLESVADLIADLEQAFK